MAHANRAASAALILATALTLAGCATAAAMRAGQHAEGLQDYDRAIVEYTRVLRDDPDNQDARLGLERMRMRSSLDHFTRGRRLSANGRFDEAVLELQIAAELNPTSPDIQEALENARTELRTQAATERGGKTDLETLIERARSLPPLGADLPADAKLPADLVFPQASARVVYTALAKFANISLVFDPEFRDQVVSIDLRDATLRTALDALAAASRTFYRVSSQRTVTVVPDTPDKRREYEEEVLQTFYLSNADLKETIDLLRIVIDARRIAPVTGTNAISIRDTRERVAAAARLIEAIDKARPEVVIHVELLEVDRTRFKEYGLQLASPDSPGIDGAVTVDDGDLTLRDLRNLTQSDIQLTNLPGLFYRLLKTDTSTRTLASPQLRTTEGMPAQAQFGERVPVPITQFAPIATGGINQQPITSFQYEPIGVNIDITPRTHHNDDVSLALKIEVSSVSGEGFGGLPTFASRSISTVIRLRDGETNLLAGLIRDDERHMASGIPGLSDLPVVGRLFARTRREAQETDIVLTLTPRIVRVLELSESDLRPFLLGRDGQAGAAATTPTPQIPQPALPQQPPLAPPSPPAEQPPDIGPILPPGQKN